MTKVLASVAAAAVLVLGLAVFDTQAQTGHRHGIAVKAFAKQVKLPRSNDPVTAGVVGVTATCPKNYRAVGGGHDSNRIAYVPVSKLGFAKYSVIAVNRINQAGVLEAEVGCVPGKTNLATASASSGDGGLSKQVAELRRQARRLGG